MGEFYGTVSILYYLHKFWYFYLIYYLFSTGHIAKYLFTTRVKVLIFNIKRKRWDSEIRRKSVGVYILYMYIYVVIVYYIVE